MAEDRKKLNELAEEYFDLQSLIAELNERCEAIKDQLKTIMVDQATEELEGRGWRATWHSVTTNRFDSTAFKKQHADLYSQFCKASTGTRFTLNQIKS